MVEQVDVIHIRAAQSDKTYIGAEFCADEERFRDVCENLDPLDVIDVNAARTAVQQGMEPQEALASFHLDQASARGRKSLAFIMQQCLNRIDAGACAAYPKDR